MEMSTDETIPSDESTDPFRRRWFKKFTIYRWLFIIGLAVMVLRILGVGGGSDITQIVNAEKAGNFVTIVVDILTDGAFIVTLFYVLLRPSRRVFIVGATLIFFYFWSMVILDVTGAFKGSLADDLSFMVGPNSLSDISGAIASVFPLFGFFVLPPREVETLVPVRKEEKIVSLAVPILAGALIALMPLTYFTGSASSGPTTFHGIGAGILVGGGIIAAILGFFRKTNLNLFWGIMLSMWILETWQAVTHLFGSKPSYWPGWGMIVGIIACLLLLFSAPAARLATRLLFARRPVISESV